MIPDYPVFKSLELADREAVAAQTCRLPPYSDFEFGNLWSWNVKGEMALSALYGNLVVRFTDYETGTPFLTFLGTSAANKTARTLLAGSAPGCDACLRLVPEIAAKALDPDEFQVEEERDHLDYVCALDRHLEYAEPCLKSQRRQLAHFLRSFPRAERVALDLRTRETREEIEDLWRRWREKKTRPETSEPEAHRRLCEAAHALPLAAIGIKIVGRLVAFHVASLPEGDCAHALFAKADTAYRGVYAALDSLAARDLIARGYTRMNVQQDLGQETLRSAKLALRPIEALRKYRVERRS
ncbi:MAG: GNAT family N-acetyltransferase [Alphaproteobacteria bacterium]|nr:GNAT family N-acetyltransferase [Alphaproteobacteria bacterium]